MRASKNKLDRLTLKASVIYHQDREQSMLAKDKEVQIKSFFEEVKAQQESYKLQIGEKVEARVSLAKDYGNIVSVEKYPGLTGFILSEHLTNKKEYKEGSKVSCIVLDLDFEKEILDLSERLGEKQAGHAVTIKVGHQYKAVVELNKEDYLLVSFKQSKTSIGLLMMQSLNNDQVPHPNEKFQIGDEIDVNVISITDNGFILTVPVQSQISAKSKSKGGDVLRMETSSL